MPNDKLIMSRAAPPEKETPPIKDRGPKTDTLWRNYVELIQSATFPFRRDGFEHESSSSKLVASASSNGAKAFASAILKSPCCSPGGRESYPTELFCVKGGLTQQVSSGAKRVGRTPT